MNDVLDVVIYDRRRWWGYRPKRQVRLLPISDDHPVFRLYNDDRGEYTVTMADVLAVGVPKDSPRGHAYVLLEPGDRKP